MRMHPWPQNTNWSSKSMGYRAVLRLAIRRPRSRRCESIAMLRKCAENSAHAGYPAMRASCVLFGRAPRGIRQPKATIRRGCRRMAANVAERGVMVHVSIHGRLVLRHRTRFRDFAMPVTGASGIGSDCVQDSEAGTRYGPDAGDANNGGGDTDAGRMVAAGGDDGDSGDAGDNGDDNADNDDRQMDEEACAAFAAGASSANGGSSGMDNRGGQSGGQSECAAAACGVDRGWDEAGNASDGGAGDDGRDRTGCSTTLTHVAVLRRNMVHAQHPCRALVPAPRKWISMRRQRPVQKTNCSSGFPSPLGLSSGYGDLYANTCDGKRQVKASASPRPRKIMHDLPSGNLHAWTRPSKTSFSAPGIEQIRSRE